MRSGSLTPREWIDWVLEQYGMTVHQIASGAATGKGVAVPALTLISNVLSDRFGASLTAEILNHRMSGSEREFSRSQIQHRLSDDVREKHGVTRTAVDYHIALLASPPHVRAMDEGTEEVHLPLGWEEHPIQTNGVGHHMASAYRPGSDHGITVWAWDEESARTALYAAVNAAEGVRNT